MLGKFTSIFEDRSASQKIENIIQKSDSFIPSKDEVPNFNITKSAIWLKMKITVLSKGDWRLEAANASMNKIDFYSVKNGKVLSEQFSGLEAPDQIRQYQGGHIMFETGLVPGDTIDAYLRIESAGPMTMPIRAGKIGDIFESDHYSNLLNGFYFGIMLLMVLYNLFLYFTNRGLVYIYYILYVIFSGIFVAFFLGYSMIYPSPVRYFFVRCPVLVPLMFGMFGLLFTTKFLNTKALAPRYHKAINIFIYLVTIPGFLGIANFRHESVWTIQLFGIILVVLSLSVGIRVLRGGYRPAKFYVLGFGAYMLGLLTLIVSNATHTSFLGMENYTLEIGSAFEAIMLSFAIGDKLNIANSEKEKARASALEAVRENERIVREQNIILEQKVKERTLELQEQKNLVEEKNKDILDSIRYAKRIQESLLPSEKYIARQIRNKAR